MCVESLLKHLQTPAEGYLFEDYLQEAWNLFRFPGDSDLAAFEAFLVVAVLRAFDGAEYNKNEAQKRDACLVGLGLLKGCYHTDADEENGVSKHCTLEDRYICYLDRVNRDYIKLCSKPKKGENFDITDSQSLPRRSLTEVEEAGRKQLAAHLEQMLKRHDASCEEYLGIGRKNHMEEVGGWGTKLPVLPPPCYTLENFPPRNGLVHLKKHWKWVALVLIIAALSLVLIYGKSANNQRDDDMELEQSSNYEGGGRFNPDETSTEMQPFLEAQPPDASQIMEDIGNSASVIMDYVDESGVVRRHTYYLKDGVYTRIT